MKTYHEVCLHLQLVIIIVTLSSFAAFVVNYNGQEIELVQPINTVSGIDMRIGTYDNAVHPFNGLIDGLRVYGKPLLQ